MSVRITQPLYCSRGVRDLSLVHNGATGTLLGLQLPSEVVDKDFLHVTSQADQVSAECARLKHRASSRLSTTSTTPHAHRSYPLHALTNNARTRYEPLTPLSLSPT